MILSEAGEIAQQMLTMIPVHFPFAGLDEFIVMPDHVHAIIFINELQNNQNTIGRNDDAIVSSHINNGSLTGNVEPLHATVPDDDLISGNIEPLHATVLPPTSINIIDEDKTPYTNSPGETKNIHMSSISPSTGSLATIIRSYKSAVTKSIHEIDPDFQWQQSFYDHIIRTGMELARIRDYIKSNPKKWNCR